MEDENSIEIKTIPVERKVQIRRALQSKFYTERDKYVIASKRIGRKLKFKTETRHTRTYLTKIH